MLINKEEKKVVDILRNCIEKANTGTLFFNNSFPEYDDEYVGKILSVFFASVYGVLSLLPHCCFGLISCIVGLL